VRKLCEEIIRRKIEIFWGCLTRANNIDFSLLQIMKKAGCREVQIGVESGDEEVLKSINKNITLKEIEEAFKILKKVGINTKGFFILGHPKDTPKTIKKTINFALKLSPTYAFFSIFTPYPGLPVYEEYKRKGYLKTEDFSQFNYHSYPVFETENLKRETLIKLKRSAEIKFYLHPKRIFFYLKEIIRSKKIKKMWKNFLIFLDLIR
jgi:anaerobic magnesium-protoporphyrin IX monomethyl ester cyclase